MLSMPLIQRNKAVPSRRYCALLLPLFIVSSMMGVVSASLGINALAKSNDQKKRVKAAAPAGVTVNINTNDVVDPGIVLTVGCGLFAFFSFIFALEILIWHRSSRASAGTAAPSGSKRHVTGYRIQAIVFGFLSIWMLACLVPVLDFSRHRSAKVSAFLGTIPLPASLVSQAQQSLGISNVYWDQHYLRVAAIVPWFAFGLAVVTTVIALLAARADRLAGSGSVADNESTSGSAVPHSEMDEKRLVDKEGSSVAPSSAV